MCCLASSDALLLFDLLLNNLKRPAPRRPRPRSNYLSINSGAGSGTRKKHYRQIRDDPSLDAFNQGVNSELRIDLNEEMYVVRHNLHLQRGSLPFSVCETSCIICFKRISAPSPET